MSSEAAPGGTAQQAGPATGHAPAQSPSVLAAHAVLTALVRAGVREFVLSPGSRSAPFVPVLAAAQAQGLLRVRVVLDERSVGFVALGMSRAALLTGRCAPAAVVTTSGTAVANLHPAVLEADAAGVPLLVISADRPHELVGTGASQTTEQTRLFEPATRLVVDLPADITADLGQERGTTAIMGQVRRAVEAACGGLSHDPGPAQLNVRLRPPLVPVPGAVLGIEAAHELPESGVWGAVADDTIEPTAGGRGPGRPAAHRPAAHEPAPVPGQPPTALAVPGPAERGLVVAGDSPDGTGALARDLAEHLGWPLLAEPTSGARGGHLALTRYAELLATPAGQELAAQAEHVLVLGHPSLTRPVSALLARTDIPVDVLASTPRWTDVAGAATRVTPLPADLTGAPGAAHLSGTLGLRPAPAGWSAQWADAVAALPAALEPGALTSAAAAVAVWEAGLRPGAPLLVVGSSMAVRHLDRLARPAEGPAPSAVANRGLAGIDGTLGTALGLHLAAGEPVRVVVGDLTFLHDAMSLGRGTLESEPDLQVVVLDDHGGAIFSTLEYPGALEAQVVERFLTTPQATEVAALAAALGAHVHQPGTLTALDEILARPVGGLSVVHLAF
ncbi:2-succinyl-5-enolpyruvyl-6-hydroxy-3-cyclohexene-1-carboxylic-acid synthase [Actinomyces respiraculi]|uniref:2-succinyl-5-enolpyruvyl-6-hydroxy-3-cyclohexene-1-carboxylate synthase n=1 Tax=Actinomyces respiraculi TaxID=2744574 RepID=A0A7T0PY51_9ACTO|nr:MULTISPECIES: 2-succinyl-5-enolpyruvyl-6-hydroxy-3-cyclohexene-1-carboxylic-acid synthase [Actinomyces]QPL06485.1 2-succinyl-5-enolpyruvyl-6-hydroxy-3-cyclohexene-1-carboxylic-acid synthase [Actinomyces respiraculi]